jgi:hypothetical protein
MGPKGWYSRGYLPHFDSPETVQFVTFRLADSLPKAAAQALAMLPDNLAQTDERLDAGWGACWLGQSEIAELVEGALLHFDKDRYRLLAWCIMPNHVHAVVEPSERHALDRIVTHGNPSVPLMPIKSWAEAVHSGIATTSTGSSEMKVTSIGPLSTLRTIQ